MAFERRIAVKGDMFTMSFPYNPGLVSAVKCIPGRRYWMGEKVWTVPGSAADQVVEFAKAYQFSMTTAAIELVKARRSMVRASEALKSEFTVEGLGGTLRPYQQAGAEYALKAKRCFIADEMGVGKTMEAIATIQAAGAYPALVVCPATVKAKWRRELEKWLPGKTVSVVNGGSMGKAVDVAVINWDILGKHADALIARGFQAVVFDESHYAKNYKAKRTKVATKIAKGVPIRLAMTGTPLLSRPNELVAQLGLLDRLDDVGGFWHFVKRYCNAKKTQFGWDMSGAANLGELNEVMRSSFYLRRSKADVLPELPEKVRDVIPVKLTNSAEYRKAETALREYLQEMEGMSEASISAKMRAEKLVKIEVTKQLATKGKMQAVREWIDSFLETGEKLVVFAHHQSVVRELAEAYSAPVIMGDVSAKQREAAELAFQTDPECKLIVCNIKAGGVGIDLFAASNVAFVELGWTPGDHDQAEDRCHRMGQKSSVNAWYFLAEDSVDEMIYGLIEHKRDVVSGATDGTVNQASVLDDLVATLVFGKMPKQVPSSALIAEKQVQAKKTEKVQTSSNEWLLEPNGPEHISKALVALYQCQTPQEQAIRGTVEQNGRGFNGVDATFGSSLAQQVLAGRTLTLKQLRAAQQMLKKYTNQLSLLGIK